jgi:hypothetical protein
VSTRPARGPGWASRPDVDPVAAPRALFDHPDVPVAEMPAASLRERRRPRAAEPLGSAALHAASARGSRELSRCSCATARTRPRATTVASAPVLHGPPLARRPRGRVPGGDGDRHRRVREWRSRDDRLSISAALTHDTSLHQAPSRSIAPGAPLITPRGCTGVRLESDQRRDGSLQLSTSNHIAFGWHDEVTLVRGGTVADSGGDENRCGY